MFAKKLRLLVCTAVMSLSLLPQAVFADEVYVGTEHEKDYWLLEETIVLEQGVYKTDTKNLRGGELDSVTHWQFVSDGRHWYFLRSQNEQLHQTGGSPVDIRRSELARRIFNYCVDYIGQKEA